MAVPATAFCVVYIVMAVLLPFLMLLWTSVQPFYAIPSADSLARVTFEGYVKIWQDGSVVRALWNTRVLALVTSVATIVLAVLVSWFVVRRRRASGRHGELSRHGIVFAAMRAEHRHRTGVYFRLRAFSDSDLRHALDHRAGDDDALSRLQLAGDDFGAHAGARRARRSVADGRRAVGADAAADHDAAIGAGNDQRVFLGGGARDAGAVDGLDALQSGHGGRLDDDLEHVAERPNRGRGGLGRVLDYALRCLLLAASCSPSGAAQIVEVNSAIVIVARRALRDSRTRYVQNRSDSVKDLEKHSPALRAKCAPCEACRSRSARENYSLCSVRAVAARRRRLRCIAGLEQPLSGEIVINDRTVFSANDGTFIPPERRHIGMVFQSYAIWPHMTVFQNVAYPLASAAKRSEDQRAGRAEYSIA